MAEQEQNDLREEVSLIKEQMEKMMQMLIVMDKRATEGNPSSSGGRLPN